MGDIAEITLNGFLCEQCGEIIDFEIVGYPRKCEFCEDNCEEDN